jgi:transposase
VNVAVDALGNPVRITLTPGQAADISEAPALIAGFSFEAVIADTGYDSDGFIEIIEAHTTDAGMPAQAVIPPKKNRKAQREYDRHLYKVRNLVERFIGRVKHFRRIATRYEKTDHNYLAFWHFASLMVLLR